MLITKFNRMIRNRVMWGIFAVIVCISFVGAFSKSGGCVTTPQGGIAVMFDKPVSQRDFKLARYFAAGMRDLPNLTPEREKQFTDLAWRRMAAIGMAERLGLTVSDSELASQIASDSGFQANGAFSRDRYNAFLQSQRMTPQLFEQYLREELVLRKLAMLMQASVWAPASEVAERARNLTDELTIQVANLPKTIAEKPDVSARDAESFYEGNSNMFAVPAKARVCYVAFEIPPVPSDTNMPEQDIEDYYVDHQGDYTVTDTNMATTVRPLEEVRSSILDALHREKGFDAARRQAADFAEKLLPDRDGRMASFHDMAAQMGVPVLTTGLFTVRQQIEGVTGCPSFAAEAFSLIPDDSERSVSDPVTGSNGVYVISAIERHESHIPAFSNIVDQVMPLAESNAFHKAFLAAADKVRADVESDLAAGRTFAEALKARQLNVSTTLTFTAYEADPVEIKDFYTIVPAVIQLPQGSVSAVAETEDGAVIARVEKRVAGEAIAGQMLKPRICESIDRSRSGILFSDWSRYVLKTVSGFKETAPPSPAAPRLGEDEEPPASPAPIVPPAFDDNLG